MLIGTNSTVLGQWLIHPDCEGIHYTLNQDRRANECLINKPKKEEQIKILQSDNFIYISEISQYKAQKDYLGVSLSKEENSHNKTKKKLKFSMNLNKYGIPISFGLGIAVTLYLLK